MTLFVERESAAGRLRDAANCNHYGQTMRLVTNPVVRRDRKDVAEEF